MISSTWQKRLMVPRWRSVVTTLGAAELGVPPRVAETTVAGAMPAELERRLRHWRGEHSLINAAELIESALVYAQEGEAVRAARTVLAPRSSATTLIKRQAASVLSRSGHSDELTADVAESPMDSAAVWRERTRIYPQNALAWVELARHQTIRGHIKHAMRSMTIALQLAPNNRHVLRSAARLYLHAEDPERAHSIVASNPTTSSDPWLLAAEVSLAELAARPARFLKRGLALLGHGDLAPHQITELAGAVATREMSDGDRRRARRHFSESMLDPNGNALAQAEWASTAFGVNFVPEGRLASVPEAFEARAIHLFAEGQFAQIAAACRDWAENEPYSIRPYEFGAMAAGILDDYETANELTLAGLKLAQHSGPERTVRLLNSRAFALASMGRTDDADTILRTIVGNRDDWNWLVAQANRGLVAYRRGRLEEGAALYREATEGFRRLGNSHAAASATAYWAREAARAGTPDAQSILANAKALAKGRSYPDVERAIGVIELLVQLSPTGQNAGLDRALAVRQ